jgi:hypothetical protein
MSENSNLLGDFGNLLYSGIQSGSDFVRDWLPSQINLGDTSGYFTDELPMWMFEPAQQAYELPMWMFEPARQALTLSTGMPTDSLGDLISAQTAKYSGQQNELPWYTQASNFLRDNKDLLGFGVGGIGALASYLDAKKRNKLVADALKKQLARKAVLDAEKKALGTPMDYTLTRMQVASPYGGRNEATYFTNNALSANPGVLRAARGGYVQGPSSGTADDVPAMLSEGEFVVPADVVSHLGNGNNNAGAAQLQQMIQQARQHRNGGGSALPPTAKPPLAYMQKGRK